LGAGCEPETGTVCLDIFLCC